MKRKRRIYSKSK